MKKLTQNELQQQANSPEELLDLVNEQDKVIGQVLRKVANQDPQYIHREVAVLIVNAEMKVLFQQRSKHKEILPLVWTLSCAGHIPTKMVAVDVAHQELQEELGFDTELVFFLRSSGVSLAKVRILK